MVISGCLCIGNHRSPIITPWRLQLPDAAHLPAEGNELLTPHNDTHMEHMNLIFGHRVMRHSQTIDILMLFLLCQWPKIKLNPIKLENTFSCACNSIHTCQPWATWLTGILSICQWVCYSCINGTRSASCGVWVYVLSGWTRYTPTLLWILCQVQCSP